MSSMLRLREYCLEKVLKRGYKRKDSISRLSGGEFELEEFEGHSIPPSYWNMLRFPNIGRW